MVTIARFPSKHLARRLCDQLQAAGIETVVNETGNHDWHGPRGRHPGTTLEVDADSFEAAMALMRSLDLLDFSVWTGLRCPACGSHKTERVNTYCSDMPLVLFLASLLFLGLPLLLRRRRLRCFDCGRIFAA
ncbi:MAG: hypothetical protein JXR77_09670 [Lentisphaeria bacterium]|nr:hypothetical protein [Lentisphaeria bacterium]